MTRLLAILALTALGACSTGARWSNAAAVFGAGGACGTLYPRISANSVPGGAEKIQAKDAIQLQMSADDGNVHS
jgi:hypothetical protein